MIKNNFFKKQGWNRSWITMVISYISQPKLSRYASRYDSYSNESSLYLYAYPIKHNKHAKHDISYKIYSTRCDMKNINNFPKYVSKHFSKGDVVNALVITSKNKRYKNHMITKIEDTPKTHKNSNISVKNTVDRALSETFSREH